MKPRTLTMMKKRPTTMTPAVLLVLLCSFLGFNSAQGKSFVSVQIPHELHNRDGEEHATAEFGFQQQHHGSIAAYVYLVDSTFCSEKPGNTTRYLYPSTNGLKKSPYMLMALGGGDCTAVTKARNAQRVGASGLIVAHQDCRCSDKACTDAFGPDCVNETGEIMINDGSAGDVSIPSLLLYKTVANKIMDELKKDQPVLMEFNWGLKEDDDIAAVPTVDFNLWTTAHDPILDLETYRNFQTVTLALEPQAMFEPRFSLVPGSRFNCDKQVDTNGPCDHLCTNHGRYCALHAANLSGHAIVAETLRRLCVWKEYGTNTSDPPRGSKMYWDYLLYHIEHCSAPHLYNDTECIQNAYTAANIVDSTVVTQCMSDSGGLDDDVVNTLLDKELTLQDHSSVVALPALTIGAYVLEQASSWNLFEGLCRHFWTRNLTTTPDVCFQCAACPNVIGCLESGGTCVDFKKPPTVAPASKGDSGKKKKHHGWKVFWFFAIAACLGGGYLYHKKMQDNEGSYRGGAGGGGGILNGYFQLAGEEQ
jgi:hypothetical protein